MNVARFSRYDLDKFGGNVVFPADAAYRNNHNSGSAWSRKLVDSSFKSSCLALRHVVHTVTHHETNKKVLVSVNVDPP